MTAGSADSAAATLDRGLAELGLPVSEAQRAALLRLAELLEEWGGRLNLSGHRSAERVVGRLVLDAVALLEAAPPFAGLADLGSGAGFPGLPIAILRPEVPVILVESRERRHHFQRAARRELGLENARPLLGRAEDLEPEPQAAVIAQAMAHPERALSWMLPWARPGAWLLIPGAETPPRIPSHPEIAPEAPRSYQVPCGGPARTLWIARRLL